MMLLKYVGKLLLFFERIVWNCERRYIISQMKSCGNNVSIDRNVNIPVPSRISLGNQVYIGPNATLYSALADIVISDFVIIGPNVTIITGDHRIDVVGKHMCDVHDEDKLPDQDAKVVIEKDVWIGSNVVILKGVTVGTGSVIAAGSIVTRNIPPYTVYIPGKSRPRFSEAELKEHLAKLGRKI